MINEIILSNRYQIDYLKKTKEHPIEIFGATNHKWNLISIYDSYNTKYLTTKTLDVLKLLDCNNMLNIQFDNITPEYYSEHDNSILFSSQDANNILNFADELKETKNNETLIIQCQTGIHSSGAIGLYLIERFNLNIDYFNIKYPQLKFNMWVYTLLKQSDYPRIK